MAGKFARETDVSCEKSKMEIERTLRRYGAAGFLSGWDGTKAFISFIMSERQVRMKMVLPDPKDRAFTHHSRGLRAPDAAHEAWEQACRQRWRAMLLVIKAKLEAIEVGISVFDNEFLAHIVLDNGRTVAEELAPQLTAACRGSGRLLLGHSGGIQ